MIIFCEWCTKMYHIVFFMSPPRIIIWLWSSGRPLWQGAQQAQLRNITKEKSESKPVYQSIIVMYLYQLYPSREYIPYYYYLFVIAHENVRKWKDCHKGKKIQPPIAHIVFLWLCVLWNSENLRKHIKCTGCQYTIT